MARTGCTNHCMGCQRHFSSLSGFDAHRKGGECHAPIELHKKNGEPLFTGIEGFCNKMPGCFVDGKHIKDVEPVVVWQGYVSEADRVRLQEAFPRP